MEKLKARKITPGVTEQQLLKDLEVYREKALAMGAADVKVVPAGEVVVDERVRIKCAFPRCHLYGESPNCPPYTPEPEQMRKVFSKYRYAVLIKTDVNPKEDFADNEGWHHGHMKHQQKSDDLAGEIEALAYNDGYYFAVGFGAGGCKSALCKGQVCQFLDSGRCRFPLRSRPSMEGVGIDVFRLVSSVGWDVYPIAHKNADPDSIKCAISVGIVFID